MKKKVLLTVLGLTVSLLCVFAYINKSDSKCTVTATDRTSEEESIRKRQVVFSIKDHHNATEQTTFMLEPMLRTTASVKDKFTVIIPTYKRIKLLTRILNNYCSLTSHIDALFVVWNDLQTDIPESLKQLKCGVTLYWKKEKTNSLNNRFIPYPEIRTEGVLSADDDLMISHKDLIFQFETWQQFKHLIVGFAARRHMEVPPGSGKYVYIKKVTRDDPRYSFILTTSAMFHVKYLELYQTRLPQELRVFIDQHMNCEDILINAIVAEHIGKISGKQCPALLIEEKDIQLIEKENVGYKGLWYRKQHKSVREKCLSLIAKYFNGMPFDYSALKVTHVFQEEETPLLDSPAAAASVIDHNQRSETDANNKQKL